MFTAAALLGVRNVAVASIVIVPGMAYGLAGLGSITGHERKGRAAVAGVVIVALLGGLLVVNAAASRLYDLAPIRSTPWRGPTRPVG